MKKFLILLSLLMVVFLLASCAGGGTQTPPPGGEGEVNGDPNCEHNTNPELIITERAVKATCTENGLTAKEYCMECGYVKTPATVVPATGHNIVAIAAVEATCSAPGATAGSKCTACNQTLVKPTVIPQKNHQAVTTPDVEASCTVAGSKGGTHCAICLTAIEAPEIILPYGHDRGLDHIEVTPGYAPTCKDEGLSDNVYCYICETDVIVAKPIPTTPHLAEDLEVVPGYAETCVATGLTDGEFCTYCGVTTIEQVEIPVNADSHPADVVDTIDGYAATCYADGLTDGKHCNLCQITYLPQEAITERPEHELVLVADAIAPDCSTETDGCTAHYICALSDDGCDYQVLPEVVEYAHTHGEWIVSIEAGVGTAGEKYTFCTECGKYIEDQIPALLPEDDGDLPGTIDPDGII